MANIELGDVFEIKTGKGMAYFQCVKIDKIKGDLINVFNKFYDQRPQPISKVVDVGDHYFVGFALAAAHKRRLVEKVANVPLPNNFELPVYMRDKHVVRGEFLGWHIIDVKTLKRQFVEELSPEQKQLSPIGIYNDTLLKEMLERGWSLKNW
jgi:hypothetical protein